MAYFPGQQAFRQPYPRKRTQQGGNGRAVSESGVPNIMARGFQVPGRGPGNRLKDTPEPGQVQAPTGMPQPVQAGAPGRFRAPGRVDPSPPRRWLESMPPRPRDTRVDGRPSAAAGMFGGPSDGRPNLTGDIFGGPSDGRPNLTPGGAGAGGGPLGGGVPGQVGPRPGPHIDPNTLLGRQPVGQHRDPLAHQRFWENWGWRWNGSKFVPVPQHQGAQPGGGGPNGSGPGGGGGGGGGGPLGGGGGPGAGPGGGPGPEPDFGMGPDPMTADMIANLRHKIGLPLDPQFEAARRMLRDQLQASLTGQQAQYGVNSAALNAQGVQAGMAENEDMAARGLFGSGIDARGDRIIGDQQALGASSLLGDYTQGQQGAQMDFRRGMIEALLDLARRSARDTRAPALKG